MVLHPAKLTGISVLFMLGLGSSPVQAEAEVRFDTDYIAIVIEAEDHSTREDRWILTDATTPAQEQDPDGNHSDGAVGGVYLELLPDVRVTHDDPFGPPTAIWNVLCAHPRLLNRDGRQRNPCWAEWRFSCQRRTYAILHGWSGMVLVRQAARFRWHGTLWCAENYLDNR